MAGASRSLASESSRRPRGVTVKSGRKTWMRKRKSSDNSTRKARSSPERSSTPVGHTAVGDVVSPRHQAAERSTKTGAETRPERDYGGWEPTIPLIRLPGRAETASPRKGKHKAHSLIDKVYNEMNLYRAWRKVRANKGTHGLDRVTIRMFETDLDTHLREIQRKLKEHRFEPQPVLRVYIPKPADPKKRHCFPPGKTGETIGLHSKAGRPEEASSAWYPRCDRPYRATSDRASSRASL